MKTPIEKLLQFCIDQTDKGNDFFMDYSGHIKQVQVYGFHGKWAMRKDSIELFSCLLVDLDDAKVDRWISFFEYELKNQS